MWLMYLVACFYEPAPQKDSTKTEEVKERSVQTFEKVHSEPTPQKIKSKETTALNTKNPVPVLKAPMAPLTPEVQDPKSKPQSKKEAPVAQAPQTEPAPKVLAASKPKEVTSKAAPKKKRRSTKSSSQCQKKIDRVMRKAKRRVQFCYNREMIKSPYLKGDFLLSIRVGKSKNSVKVYRDTVKSTRFKTCVVEKIEGYDFGSQCVGVSFKKKYVLRAQ